jgi:lysyl-tRNA synthetase class 2
VTRPPLWWRASAAAATLVAAVLMFVSSVSPNVPWRNRVLESLEPEAIAAVAHAAGVAGALTLLALSWGVLQGRHGAGRIAVVVLGVLAVVNAAKGLDYEEATIAIALALALRAGLRAAAIGARPPSAAATALVVAGALAAGYAVAVTALLISGHSPRVAETLVRSARAVADGNVPAWVDDDARVAFRLLLGVSLAGVVLVLRDLLAPVRPADGHDAAAHTRAAAIVAAHGEDSIAPFTLRADKSFFFAHGGLLAYRTVRGTAVVSGDPVGPPGAAPRIVGDFLALAGRRRWDVAIMAARDEHLDAYRALGLRTLRIGSEAVVDPRSFTLSGNASRTVRKAVNRVRRHGWTIAVVPGDALTPGVVAEIDAVEHAWRLRHPRLHGFSMAADRLWGAPEDTRDVYVVARERGGEARAFQRYVPYHDGLSLDAMRRLDDEPNGISDALVAAALGEAARRGCHEVSLNFSSLAHVLIAGPADSVARRAARRALRPLHRRFQLERLMRFASKFGPSWRARHLVYTRRTRLPVCVLRIMQAEAYVRSPRQRPRHDAWRPLLRPPSLPGEPG